MESHGGALRPDRALIVDAAVVEVHDATDARRDRAAVVVDVAANIQDPAQRRLEDTGVGDDIAAGIEGERATVDIGVDPVAVDQNEAAAADRAGAKDPPGVVQRIARSGCLDRPAGQQHGVVMERQRTAVDQQRAGVDNDTVSTGNGRAAGPVDRAGGDIERAAAGRRDQAGIIDDVGDRQRAALGCFENARGSVDDGGAGLDRKRSAADIGIDRAAIIQRERRRSAVTDIAGAGQRRAGGDVERSAGRLRLRRRSRPPPGGRRA